MNLYESFLFGITLGISIGPIALLIFNNGLTYNRRAGFLSGLGAALADLTYALLGFTIGSILTSAIEEMESSIRIFSGLVLLAFGLFMLYNAIAKSDEQIEVKKTSSRFLIDTYLLTMANPLTILLFAGFAGRMAVGTGSDAFLNAVAVFIGSLLVQGTIALGGAAVGKLIKDPGLVRWSRILSALIICAFGITSLLLPI